MKLLPRGLRWRVILWVLWAAGTLGIWWLLPPQPRYGWQPTPEQRPLGFLADSHILVTCEQAEKGYAGPVRLWDVDSGQCVASHFGAEDRFLRVFLDPSGIRLQVIQPSQEAGAEEDDYTLRLLEARSGNEIVRFSAHAPKGNVWWRLSADGTTSAFVTHTLTQVELRCHELPSGGLLRSIAGVPLMCFSPEGRYLATTRLGSGSGFRQDGEPATFTVWEVPAFREICSITVPGEAGKIQFASQFSPDGKLLLDSQGRLWELHTGKVRFQLPVGESLVTFSATGGSLVVRRHIEGEAWLRWYDVETGEEQPEKHLRLFRRQFLGWGVFPATPDRRYILTAGSEVEDNAPRSNWPRWVPFIRHNDSGFISDRYVLIDGVTGREVARGNTCATGCSPDGRILLSRDRAERVLLWDVPPREPLLWIGLASGGLALCLWLLARRPWRWSRREPTDSSPPVTASSPG